ncbi:sulfatase-like hydrolase/transferase [Dysgonomonas sp. 216]|uniref:sulfatase-like hydrolase/transferase n=1 Tax=Dysgonomonas sp. 216 TaxID=2302934 RepID=UPI0021024AF4|nr:sulfatase-like hydrolase/transferase [Dysgonomonas sp. 216]
MSTKTEKIIYSIILVISILPGTIFLGYLLFAKVLLEQNSITSLFETNPEESKEFLVYYLNSWVVLGVSFYAILPAVMVGLMRSAKSLTIRKHKKLFIIALTTVLAIVFIPNISKSVYFLNFYRTYISYKIRVKKETWGIAERQKHPYEVSNMYADSIPQTIVVVIGESQSKKHMQLYGYERKTNPLLSAKNDSLHIYTDVVPPQVHTIPVMRSILTLGEHDCPEFFIEKPSLFELFNRAGYTTYLISNQSFGGPLGTSYDVLLNLAQHKYDLSSENKHDEVVLKTFTKALKKAPANNKLIVIHLIGNHMAYKFRYPPQFAKFDNTKDDFIKPNNFISNQVIPVIDEYDNSILYNDYVVNKILDTLIEKGGAKTSLVYFSDHAEELYNYRNFAGHAYEKISPYMCEIPFFVWISERFSNNRNDIVIEPSRPYSTADLVYSISNLAGIDYIDYDKKRSLFSPDFKPSERYVGSHLWEDLIAR